MFYPSSAYELKSDVTSYMARARPPRLPTAPKALIAPHAGYPYSGPVAGSAFKSLNGMHKQITRVILFGPSHHVSFRGMALSSADVFHTPLGEIEVDHQATEELNGNPLVVVNDHAHRDEHSLEVELPFLQCALDDFTIVPVVVGNARAEEVSSVMELLWGGPETLIVVSSDLSHYHAYELARDIDRQTTDAIVALAPERISPDQACGRLAVQGLLLSARKHTLRAVALDVRNSGDTAGDRRQVVGYGAYVFIA